MRDMLPKPQDILKTVFTVAKDKPYILTPGQFTLEPVEHHGVMFFSSLEDNSKNDIIPIGQQDYIVALDKTGHLAFYQVMGYDEVNKDHISFHGLKHEIHVHFILSQADISYIKGYMSCLTHRA